jgi:adenylate kinase family enzyme
MRIALVGHSGAGKSTSAALLKEHFEAGGRQTRILKLATPLYQLQREYYRVAGAALEGQCQDQVLLEAIATQLRRISPRALVSDFYRRLLSEPLDVVINDDLRDGTVDYWALKDWGFKFIRIDTLADVRRERLSRRGDLTVVTNSETTASVEELPVDHVVNNDSNEVARLRGDLLAALGRLS